MDVFALIVIGTLGWILSTVFAVMAWRYWNMVGMWRVKFEKMTHSLIQRDQMYRGYMSRRAEIPEEERDTEIVCPHLKGKP